MITQESIKNFKGSIITGDENCLYILPHKMLQPFIANYTISFPNPQTMPDEYTVLPSASSTLVIDVSAGFINGCLDGISTKALNVGSHANKMDLLLLIEFHAGGLHPFLPVDQTELVDAFYPFKELDKKLMQTIEAELEKSKQITELIDVLDKLFIARLMNSKNTFDFSPILKNIINHRGFIKTQNLSFPFYYSERQTRRLFLRHVGINPKMLTRIVRANYALRLIKRGKNSYQDIMEKTGYFDQPHFIHEFKTIHGITPLEYRQNMSVFYNDETKM